MQHSFLSNLLRAKHERGPMVLISVDKGSKKKTKNLLTMFTWSLKPKKV